MRAGPRGARRELRPACTPAAWFPAWASRAGAFAPLAGAGTPAPTESASRAYAWGEASGIRELGAGVDCQKVHRACTRGMRLLTRDRPAVAFPC